MAQMHAPGGVSRTSVTPQRENTRAYAVVSALRLRYAMTFMRLPQLPASQ